MTTRLALALLSIPLALAGPRAGASDPPTVPATRAELKRRLEDSKASRPRLPLPPLGEEDKAKRANPDLGKADWSVVNNGRMRRHYLAPELTGMGALRGADPNMTLGYPFQTSLFWIVSRGNNCTYCMGHQESKLAAAGFDEARIAGLDGDWSEVTPAERAAFGLARKLTFAPDAVTDADVDRLRTHYNDRQILEIVTVVAGFNAMNRWTGALAIPQEEHRAYLTPTSLAFRDMVSRVAPLDPTRTGPAPALPSTRTAPSDAEVAAGLAAARSRRPRLPLVDEAEARAVLGEAGPQPAWVRLLANFPKVGLERIKMHRAAETTGHLPPTLRAEVAHVAARRDRAWYALDLADRRLRALGLDDGAIVAIDGDHSAIASARREALRFAEKLTVDPARIDDDDVAFLRTLFDDRQVAELIHLVTESAFFDRLTEASGLRIDP